MVITVVTVIVIDTQYIRNLDLSMIKLTRLIFLVTFEVSNIFADN